NALHAAWGVGATLGPLVLTAALAMPGSWRAGYMAMAALTVLLAGVFFFTMAAPAGREGLPAERHRSPRLGPAMLLALALFFLYVGVEGGTGTWAYSFLTDGRMAPVAAGLLVSAYWGALTGGRALLALVVKRSRPERLLDVSLGLTLLGVLLLVAGWSPALLLIGLGLAAVYPALMTLT